MIVLLGSSYTRGGWGDHMDQPSAFIHTMLADALQCTVVNMSIPGSGSEIFVDAYIQAVDKYKPKLFFVELVEDRSRNMLYLPNDTSTAISNCSADALYDQLFQYGLPHEPYNENQMDDYRIHINSSVLPSYNKLMLRHQRMFSECHIQGHGYSLRTMLDWMNTLNVFHHSTPLITLSTIQHFMSLEKLSKLTRIPVLYYKYDQSLDYDTKLTTHINGRYMNQWHGLDMGTREWANIKLNGAHLADNVHLNKDADELVVTELIAPFIKNYATLHNITL